MVGTCLCMIVARLLSSTHCGNLFSVAQPVHPPLRRRTAHDQHCHVDDLDRGVVSLSHTWNVHRSVDGGSLRIGTVM